MLLDPLPPVGAVARIDSEDALAGAVLALSRLDPKAVGHCLAVAGQPTLRRRPSDFEGLARIVVGQQISTASASAIFARLATVVDPFEAAVLAARPDDALKACGLSASKIKTLRAIAEALLEGALPLDRLASMPVEEALTSLVAIKGIGPWTAEAFLLFCLGHADAWPAGDVALQEAARLALGLDRRPDAAALRAIGERWRPCRGAAAYLLWTYYRARKNRDAMVPERAHPEPA